MFVYIAHAEADQAAADDLKAFLKSRGLVVETETGARGFRHLQASDVVIALWSQKSVFGAHRMLMESRMLDAWADGRLVLVKLDHGFLPIGMRDLPAIDASFEGNRQLAVWPQVERAAKEAMNRALVEKQNEQSLGRLNSTYGNMKDAMGAGPASKRSEPVVEAAPARARRSGMPILMILSTLAGLALVSAAVWKLVTDPEGMMRLPLPLETIGAGTPVIELTSLQAALIGGGLGAALVLAAVGAVLAGGKRTASRKRAARGEPALHSNDQMLSEAGPAAAGPAPTAVFISYAHADNDAVEPVVKLVEANGRVVWIDKTGIHSGDGWAGEIVRGIKGSKGVMVMCSPNAFESDHIKREVYLADRYKKPMLPVFIADAKPPEDFEYFFAGLQWLELFRLPEADRPAAIGKALAAV